MLIFTAFVREDYYIFKHFRTSSLLLHFVAMGNKEKTGLYSVTSSRKCSIRIQDAA